MKSHLGNFRGVEGSWIHIRESRNESRTRRATHILLYLVFADSHVEVELLEGANKLYAIRRQIEDRSHHPGRCREQVQPRILSTSDTAMLYQHYLSVLVDLE